LNHIIRACILINNQTDVLDIKRKFYNNKIVKENYVECNDSLIVKIDKLTKDRLDNFIKKEMF
jgi:hypothetical protein